MQTFFEKLTATKIIAILRGLKNSDECLNVAEALHNGGISLIEVTFDHDPADYWKTTESIRRLTNEFKDEILFGAGTVLTASQVELATDAGAKYILSPDTNIEVVKKTKELGLISIPGALTPTEALSANNNGADLVKIFPAGLFEPSYIRSIKAPLRNIGMIAVGGISIDNIKNFICAGAVGVGIGEGLAKKAWVNAKEFHRISLLAQEYVKKANSL